MNLENIPTIKGSTHPNKRLGRGHGSGHGKTSGKGHKGQKARSGGGIRIGFEGGQMPLYRKLPRRGFNNHNFRISYQVVNVADLARIEGNTINRKILVQAGLVRDNKQGIKILGSGELNKAFSVEADKVSSSARTKIEEAGGSVMLLGTKTSEQSSKPIAE